jgi:hypothetical protein
MYKLRCVGRSESQHKPRTRTTCIKKRALFDIILTRRQGGVTRILCLFLGPVENKNSLSFPYPLAKKTGSAYKVKI